MRVKVHMMINPSGRTELVAHALEQGGQRDLAERGPDALGFYVAWFWEASPELDQLRASLADHGVTPLWRKELIFSERELREAALLQLIVARSPKSSGGAAAGTAYDLSSGCPQCGSGATQTSPLILRKAETPTRGKIFVTAHEVLVATEVAHFLQEQMVTGLELREARAWRTDEPLGWHQLIPTHELPPWSPRTVGGAREKPCAHCNRDGHFDSLDDPLRIVYQLTPAELAALPDVVRTWECFGNSWIEPPSDEHVAPWIADPLILVRPRIRTLLREAGVTRLRYEPVDVVPV